MLTITDIALDNDRYGGGFSCAVTFQIGPQTYSKVKVELSPEATRKVIELVIAEAKAMLTAEPGDVRIAGEALARPDAEPAPPAFLADDLPIKAVEHTAIDEPADF